MDATTYGSGLVASKDYRFACENITRGANVDTRLVPEIERKWQNISDLSIYL